MYLPLLFVQLFFVGTTAVAVNLPPRYYYPNVPGLTEPDRVACYAEADDAYHRWNKSALLPEDTVGDAVYREVNAFEQCVKAHGYAR